MKHLLLLLLLLTLINCQFIVQKWNKTHISSVQQSTTQQKMLDSFFKKGSSVFIKQFEKDRYYDIIIELANGHQKNLTKHLQLKVDFNINECKRKFGEERLKQITIFQSAKIQLSLMDQPLKGINNITQFGLVNTALNVKVSFRIYKQFTIYYRNQTISIFIKEIKLETSYLIDGQEMNIFCIILIPLCLYHILRFFQLHQIKKDQFEFDLLQILGYALAINIIIYQYMVINSHFKWSILQIFVFQILSIFCAIGFTVKLVQIIKYSYRIDHLKLKITIFIITTIHFNSYSLLLNFIFKIATKKPHSLGLLQEIIRTVFLFLLLIPFVALKHLQEKYLMYNEYYFFKLGFSQQSITNTTICIFLAVCLLQIIQTKFFGLFPMIIKDTKRLQRSQNYYERINEDE